MTAELKHEDQGFVPPLYKAQIKKVSSAGIEVHGQEVISRVPGAKSNVEKYKQVWWALTEARAIATVKIKQLEAAMQMDERTLQQMSALGRIEGWTDAYRAEYERARQKALDNQQLINQLLQVAKAS